MNPARARILAGARRHFLAHGSRSVSMDTLARELGVSKKTLYVHFPTKFALLDEVIRTKLAEVEADLARIREEHAGNPVKGLNELLFAWRQQVSEVQPGFLRDMQMEAPAQFELFSIKRRALVHKYFGGLLEEGRAAGAIRDDIPPGFIVEVLLGAAGALGRPEKIDELGLTPKALFSNLTSVLIEGMLTAKGRKRWASFRSNPGPR